MKKEHKTTIKTILRPKYIILMFLLNKKNGAIRIYVRQILQKKIKTLKSF